MTIASCGSVSAITLGLPNSTAIPAEKATLPKGLFVAKIPRNAHGLGKRRKRVHGPLEHADQQRVLATIVFTGLCRGTVDDVGDLFFADQLVINVFLYVSDSHAHHLGTCE